MAQSAETIPAAQTPNAGEAVPENADLSRLDGPQKAAIILLALGSDYGQHIWGELDDDDVVAVSLAMSRR